MGAGWSHAGSCSPFPLQGQEVPTVMELSGSPDPLALPRREEGGLGSTRTIQSTRGVGHTQCYQRAHGFSCTLSHSPLPPSPPHSLFTPLFFVLGLHYFSAHPIDTQQTQFVFSQGLSSIPKTSWLDGEQMFLPIKNLHENYKQSSDGWNKQKPPRNCEAISPGEFSEWCMTQWQLGLSFFSQQ